MAVDKLPPWKPPRRKLELQSANTEQAREYMLWFVNRRAYTCQKDKPDPESGKYFFYQARDYKSKERPGPPLSLGLRGGSKASVGYPFATRTIGARAQCRSRRSILYKKCPRPAYRAAWIERRR